MSTKRRRTSKTTFALVSGLLLVLVSIALIATIPSLALTSADANRDIEMQMLTQGGSTNITVTITNNVTQALALDEDIPMGWTLTLVDDDADEYKPSTNEWVWFTVNAGATKTVIYSLTVPCDATPGEYMVNGTLKNASSSSTVTGENTITIIADATGPTIEFVEPPTPANNSINNTGNVTITVTLTDPCGVSTVLLNWNGENESMNPFSSGTKVMYMIAADTWSIDKSGLESGIYTYSVFANDTHDNWGQSEIRFITVQKSILDYYRSWLGTGDPNLVETQELLQAADDWSNDVVPPGFTAPITTQELLQLAEEWATS